MVYAILLYIAYVYVLIGHGLKTEFSVNKEQ